MTAIGIALLVVGVVVVLIEAHVPSLGILGGPGVVALSAGAVLAVAGLGGGLALAAVAGVLLAGTGIGVIGLSISKGAAVRKRRHRNAMMGRPGVIRKWSEPERTVLVDGALWNARPSHPECDEIRTGDRVIVERVSGLTLGVRKAEDWELIA